MTCTIGAQIGDMRQDMRKLSDDIKGHTGEIESR